MSCPHLQLAVTSTDAAVADAGVLIPRDVVLGIDCDLADAVLLDLNLQLLHQKQSRSPQAAHLARICSAIMLHVAAAIIADRILAAPASFTASPPN